jgi:hypothetical protein
MKLVADIVTFDGNKLINYEPLADHFVVEIPEVDPFMGLNKSIRKSDKQIAEEMEKLLGEYFRVVSVGPKCESLKVGDDVFMIPPQKVVSFKAKFTPPVDTDDVKETVFRRFAIFKEYVVLGKLQESK